VNDALTNQHLANIFDFPGLSIARVKQELLLQPLRFTSAYVGGTWGHATTGKHGRVVLPPPCARLAPAGKYPVTVRTNGYQGDMDPATFGAALTLVMHNSLVWAYNDLPHCDRATYSRVERKYYALKSAFVNDKALDASALLGFID
jgi:hypothetical protein